MGGGAGRAKRERARGTVDMGGRARSSRSPRPRQIADPNQPYGDMDRLTRWTVLPALRAGTWKLYAGVAAAHRAERAGDLVEPAYHEPAFPVIRRELRADNTRADWRAGLSARSSRRITGNTGSWYAGSTRSPARSARWAAATPVYSSRCRPGEPVVPSIELAGPCRRMAEHPFADDSMGGHVVSPCALTRR